MSSDMEENGMLNFARSPMISLYRGADVQKSDQHFLGPQCRHVTHQVKEPTETDGQESDLVFFYQLWQAL